MKKIFLLAVGLMALGFSACSDEELTPKVDTSNEYEERLRARANNSAADAQIWEWYEKYGTAFVYDFTDPEFRWQWAGSLTDTYVQFDINNPADREMFEDFVVKIKEGFMDNYSESRLKTGLPFRVFLCKQLNENASFVSDKDTVCTSNAQDAIIVAYQGRSGKPYSSSVIGNGLSSTFAMFFYNKLKTPPTEFIESRTEVNYNLVTMPKDERVESEFKSVAPLTNDTNDPVFKDHKANVCGFIRGYLFTHVQPPTEARDFADYFAFLTCNDSETVRRYTQNYWRIAWRATLYMNYWKEYLDEDLMETHNAKYPDDKLTERDFRY